MRRGLLAVLLLTWGCEDPPAEPSCGALPDPSACPVTGDNTCADRSCTALYACREDRWVFLQKCPEQGGAGGGGAGGASGAAGSPGDCQGAMPSQTCPALQMPDCDAALIDACPQLACATGCEGFLRCEGGDWGAKYVAYCTEEGELVTPP